MILSGECVLWEKEPRESSGNANAGFTCPSGELQPLTKHSSEALRSSLGAQREWERCGLSLGRWLITFMELHHLQCEVSLRINELLSLWGRAVSSDWSTAFTERDGWGLTTHSPDECVCVLGLTADRMDSAVIIFLHSQEVLTWPSLCGEHLLHACLS